MTFEEILDCLKREEELTILELLDYTSTELVDALADKLYEKLDVLRDYYDCESDETLHGEEIAYKS